jgi:hypothetical protein
MKPSRDLFISFRGFLYIAFYKPSERGNNYGTNEKSSQFNISGNFCLGYLHTSVVGTATYWLHWLWQWHIHIRIGCQRIYPQELAAFWGKWEAPNIFLIVEKIDGEKASLYFWQSTSPYGSSGWMRYEAQVIKKGRKYKLWFRTHLSNVELKLKGEDLDWSASGSFVASNRRLKRVP